MIVNKNLLEDWMTPEFVISFLLDYMKLTQANILHLNLEKYTPTLIKKFHDSNYLLHTHLQSDDIQLYKKITEFGIDQCTFDNINLIRLIKPSLSY